MNNQAVIHILQLMGKDVRISPRFESIYRITPPFLAKVWKVRSSLADHVIDDELQDYLKFITEE